MEKRTANFNMRVSPTQKRKAKKLAKADKRSLADWTLKLWQEAEKPKAPDTERKT